MAVKAKNWGHFKKGHIDQESKNIQMGINCLSRYNDALFYKYYKYHIIL